MHNTVEFNEISKRYILGGIQGNIREAATNLLSSIFLPERRHPKEEIWALKDISFVIHPSEAVGIIGPNGAGKTTLLKILTSVTQPTSGSFKVDGRISALIELGAGFHPDLTGRENIYLNGAILGMKKQEIRQRFDEIVAFSELERFLETPVKRYSSGMYARLGFSVAAHVNPQILVVDEVLAVGDVAFQTKCLNRMAEMKDKGATILIVSHAMPRLRRLCNRAILLFRGEMIADGKSDEVINQYQNNPEYASNLTTERSLNSPDISLAGTAGSKARITGVVFLDGDGLAKDVFEANDRFVARISFQANQRIENPVFEVWIHAADGTEYASHTTAWDEFHCGAIQGRGSIDFVVHPLPLTPGQYTLGVALTAADGISRYDWQPKRYWFNVEAGHYVQGFIDLPHVWKMETDK